MTSGNQPKHPYFEPADGLFLAFEGVDGSGKSTQATLLSKYLREGGFEVVHVREPGSTALGERIRALVLDESGLGIPPRSELFLMLAARAAFVEQVVMPALRQGRIVISDRFELSTLAYQGAGRGIPYDQVSMCNHIATGGRSPDATILLDLPPTEGFRRQVAAAKRPDRLEGETHDFHDRVAIGYRVLADRVEGLIRVDGEGSIAEVHERVVAALAKRFPETFRTSRVIR
jgi:dTMP kinase